MALSVNKVDEAKELVVKAWRMLLKECQECNDKTQRDALHPILDNLERVRVSLINLQVKTFGFEFWKAMEVADNEDKRKKLANKHCRQLGLEIPYPEISEQA